MYISYAIFGLYPFGKKSVLCLDLNAQYVYFFEQLRDAFWGNGSIFYSWGRNLSGGMMGIIGYYLASPFTLIVMLLPRKMILTSLLIMILCKIGTASVTFNLYLQRSKGLEPLHATVFSVLYSLVAYMVIQTIDPMWLDGLVFLPLVALGIEYLIDDGRKINYIIPLALMFAANFYIGYMIAIFCVLYFVYYLFFGKDGGRGKISNYLYTGCNFAICSLIAGMLAAWMILPVYNALKLGKFEFSQPDYSFATQFEPATILAQLLTAQYDSVNVDGSPEIYCGILTVVLLPLYFLNSKISLRRKLGRGFLMAAMFFSMCIRPIDMRWHGGQMPNWLPFRYSFIVSFILLAMAASAWKHFDGVNIKHLGGVFFGEMAVILFVHSQGYEHLDIMKSIWLSIGLAGAYLLILYAYKLHEGKKLIPILLLCIISGELVFNNVTELKAIDKEVLYSTKESYDPVINTGREAVKLMNKHDHGLYRSEKTFSRCVNDNMAYGLKGLTHSSSVMNTRTLNFIETLGYNSRSYYTRYDGTTELADSLLGIKYVLDKDGYATMPAGDDLATIHERRRTLLHSTYPKVDEYNYTEQPSDKDADPVSRSIGIYENPNALSVGYMVSDNILSLDHLGNDNPFNSQNILFSTMLGQTEFLEDGSIGNFPQYYKRIDIGEPVLGAVTLSDYNGQACYTKTGDGDPTVDYRFTAESDQEVLFFLKTENEQAVNLWLGVYDPEIEDYRFGSCGFGQYFETHNYSILSLGHFTPGTQVSLRMTVLDKDNATIVKEPFFYYFDRELFQNDIDKLKANQLQVTKFRDDHIEGTVTAEAEQILFTSIPYEPGWTIKVDGHKVCTTGASDKERTGTFDENGKEIYKTEVHQALKAMIFVPLAAGTHTISMTYTPPGFVIGVFLMLIGIAMCVLFYRYDKKNNKVLVARANARNANAAHPQKKAAAKAPAPKPEEDDDEEDEPEHSSDVPTDELNA